MASDLQILWGCLLYDVLNITKSKREFSDEQIRGVLEKHKSKVLKVKELDLSCLSMNTIVKEIALFESLEFLDLSNCSLANVGSALESLRHLKAINFKGNQLADLSAIASSLNLLDLQSIDLSNNTFSVMPDSFLHKFNAFNREDPLHINLTGNVWLEDDEFLQNVAIKNNWVIQLGDVFF